jgi:hypothetical protein
VKRHKPNKSPEGLAFLTEDPCLTEEKESKTTAYFPSSTDLPSKICAGGGPGYSEGVSQPAQSPQPAAVRPAGGPAADEKPLLPAKSRDETDVGWGDSPEPDQSDDEERLRRERPPHWG